MKSVLETIFYVVDSNNRIFTYPDNTHLNKIPNDLWPIILRYSSQIFGIGNNNSTYPGYGIVTIEQINDAKFQEIFIAHYNSIGGIIALSHITNRWLYCGFPTTILFDMCSVFNDEPVEKGQIVKLQKCSHEKNNIIMNIVSYKNWSISQGADSICLYALNNFDAVHITHTKIIYDTHKHIFDSDNKKIITIPDNSLLNLIIDDLWPIIARYEPHLFGVGNDSDCYPDYSIVTKEQINTASFKRLFIEFCRKNGGVYSFDNNNKNHCLYGEGSIKIRSESDFIYLGNSVLTENGYMRTMKTPSHIQYFEDMFYPPYGIKLYVWSDYKFY